MPNGPAREVGCNKMPLDRGKRIHIGRPMEHSCYRRKRFFPNEFTPRCRSKEWNFSGSMIITRTPLRISIGGGGTDLPSYYAGHGGFVISAAINKHIYVGINETFSGGYFLKYSAQEHALTLDDIRHPLIREVLRLHEVPPPLEVVSMADIPAGTGLGSSGAFTVGLLRAVHALKRKYVDPGLVAEEACQHRNRDSAAAGRQAGPVHRGIWRLGLFRISGRRAGSRSAR